jgi:hypothetical protein
MVPLSFGTASALEAMSAAHAVAQKHRKRATRYVESLVNESPTRRKR